MINIIWGTTKKPVASQQLAEFFRQHKDDYNGELYIGYPIIAAPEGAYPIDALWISGEKGLVIFCLNEGTTLKGYPESQDESANRLETKLRGYRDLMKGRTLLASPEVITYAPAINIETKEIGGYRLCSDQNLKETINEIGWDNPEKLESVISVIQSISTIRKGKRARSINNADSKGAKLKELEDSIANLDNIQGRAVIETVEGVQRIRGLAGSGKTIILALKAAYLHTQHPDWKIAVTFNTRSLKDQFRRLINTFVIEQSGEEPVWTNIQILNAWGAPGEPERSGIYYQFTKLHGLEYADFQAARRKYGYDDGFSGICRDALNSIKEEKNLFDLILIDEAQDFDPTFFEICYSLLTEKKRLIYAYDELQSLTNTSLPPPEQLFGNKSDGTPKVQFQPHVLGQPQQDIILEKCYRNSRPVLATAHALGFGIYRNKDPKTGTGLIQMFDHSKLWLDVGYKVMDGQLEDGQKVKLARSADTSPPFLEHSPTEDLIQFLRFDTKEDQAAWIAKEIEKNIVQEELEPDDIIVINPDPISTRNEVGLARRILFEKGIESHLTGVDVSPDIFFDKTNKSVAFTGIFRAKGNEAGMVYIMNAHQCVQSFGSLARVRNQLFTAITRSKSWVRVLGIGEPMGVLVSEYEKIKGENYQLHFTYPTEEMRRKLNIINRDMTATEKQSTMTSIRSLNKTLDDIDAGRVMMEDLPEETLERLRTLLTSGSKHG